MIVVGNAAIVVCEKAGEGKFALGLLAQMVERTCQQQAIIRNACEKAYEWQLALPPLGRDDGANGAAGRHRSQCLRENVGWHLTLGLLANMTRQIVQLGAIIRNACVAIDSCEKVCD